MIRLDDQNIAYAYLESRRFSYYYLKPRVNCQVLLVLHGQLPLRLKRLLKTRPKLMMGAMPRRFSQTCEAWLISAGSKGRDERMQRLTMSIALSCGNFRSVMALSMLRSFLATR